ncbi:MAG: hypothetical protein AAB935_00590 [Patescibacteria group bacterium]
MFFCAIVAVCVYYFYLTYARYQLWKNDTDGIGKFLVPPHKSITYVIGYHFIRFGLYYVISLVVALIFLWAAKYYNKKFGGRFFEPEEPYFGALAIFLLGNGEWHYGWIIYFVLMLLVSVVGSLIYTKILKKNERFPMYWLWLPMGILAIIVNRVVAGSL